MMHFRKRLDILLVTICCITAFSSCKKWADHDKITDQALAGNLYQAISGTANLSTFSALLVKSGYDKIIASSRTYTVWAPDNQALQSLDPSVTGDTAKLKAFIANHISNQSYLVGTSSPAQRIEMINGKYLVLSGSQLDSANIITANKYAANGVYHILDKFIPPIDNIWQFINNTTAIPAMKSFLLSLNHTYFDPSTAKQTGVDPTTGQPIYDSSTGTSVRNYFLDSVMNVNDESNEYTMLLLTDDAYNTDFAQMTPWFKTSTPDSTNTLSGYWLVKDLAFKGAYSADQLPDTIVSQYGVKVPVNKSNIVASYKTSNGWVHVMNQVSFTLSYKFPPIIIQGATPDSFATTDRGANTFYRVRYNPVTGQDFTDILMQNYGYASYFINYRVMGVNSMRYNAYWVAVNDVQTTPLWNQKLTIDSASNPTVLPYVTVQYENYNEVSLGQFTINNYRNLNLFVVGPTTSSTAGGVDAITLDYIKLVPAF